MPIAEVGLEGLGLREHTPMTHFPAPNPLHLCWARRPLETLGIRIQTDPRVRQHLAEST
jgi:hypothetical protein